MDLRASSSVLRAVVLAVAAAITVIFVNWLSLSSLVSSSGSVEVGERIRTLIWAVGTALFIFFSSLSLGTFASVVAGWLRLSSAQQRKVFWGFTFAGPWIVGFVIFVLGPSLVSLLYSFTDYRLGDEAQWIGLENYRILLTGQGAHGRRFGQAMYNSFYYALVGVPLQILTALGMALLLNTALRGMRLFRLIFYLPVILAGGPAILLAWRYMLASNGGFINELMRSLASNFFLFDWLYRFFIYSVEGFNGFYAGIARGDPLGPLLYTIPALIGTVVLFTLVRDDWSVNKRMRAWRVAEIISLIVIVILMARALIMEPIDVALIYLCGALSLGAVLFNVWQGKSDHVRVWQLGTLIIVGIAAIVVLLSDASAPESGDKLTYLIALALVAAPMGLSMVGRWNPRKTMLLGGAVALYCGLMFISVAPSEFDNGGANVIPHYVTLTSAIEQPQDLDYLEDTFPATIMSPLWVWGAVAVVLGGAAVVNNRYPRTQRRVLTIFLIIFALFAVSSLIDGVRYFQAFDAVAQANGRPNYHFALFNNAVAKFPSQDRVPLWLSNELWSKPSLILITMWSSGAGMLIFLAALKGVPETLYEAAKVDGAHRIQRFFKITLPMISPALFYNIVVGVIAALQTFEAIYIIQTEETVDSLSSAAFFLYVRTFRQLAIGQGSAVSWILAVIIVLLTIIQFRYSSWVHYES